MTFNARPVAGVWYEASSEDVFIPRHGFVTFLGFQRRESGELGAVCAIDTGLTRMGSLVWTCIVQVLFA